MDKIEKVRVLECDKSRFIRPLRVLYTQDGKEKVWDAMKVHDSVAILIYNSTRDVFVFVRQFRPAVYINAVELTDQEDGSKNVDCSKYPGSLGITHELCAGIVDKSLPPEEIAREEVLEECGYNVPIENMTRITGFRNGVGTAGSWMTLYYTEVTDAMKVAGGGGNADEGEQIDVVELPVFMGKTFIMDESKNKPVAMMFAMQWFYENIYGKKNTNS